MLGTKPEEIPPPLNGIVIDLLDTTLEKLSSRLDVSPVRNPGFCETLPE